MNGKIVGGFIVGAALLAGATLYYLQVYGYYHKVSLGDPSMQGLTEMELTSVVTGLPEPILTEDFQGIDADSSPLRFRGCFTTPQSLAMLTETYVVMDKPEPLTGPGWFGCYDAVRIGGDLETGQAVAFMSVANIHPGIDRVIAVYTDGQAFAWHQLNAENE